MHKMIEELEAKAGLGWVLETESSMVFVLYGDICTIGEVVKKIQSRGKRAVIHMDLIQGLSAKEAAVNFLKEYTRADGIITTRPALIRRAKELGLFTVLRFFVIDSMALENIQKQTAAVMPDVVEILPGLMPKMIRKIRKSIRRPLIAGGLISDKEDIMAALDAGAGTVSTTKEPVWFM